MKRIWAIALVLMLLGGSAAADGMRVYVAKEAMDVQTASRLIRLLGGAFPQETWTLEHEAQRGESLSALVMADRAPQMAICSPSEAMLWAREGLLVPLTHSVQDQKSIAPAVLQVCTQDEALFMAPLTARQHGMAVNRRLMEKQHLGYMLNPLEHPAWLTTQLYQVLEEFLIADQPAMEIWPAQPDTCEALAALVQTLYGGCFFSEDGMLEMEDIASLSAGMAWLAGMTEHEMINMAKDQEAALARFVAGETAIFLDWTSQLQAKYAKALEENGVEVAALPYPSSSGDVVRVFELTGVSVFDSGDEKRNDLALKAVAFMHEDVQVQLLLGDRAILRDDAQWLPALGMREQGATVRALLCDTLQAVMEGEEPDAALGLMQAAMQALH